MALKITENIIIDDIDEVISRMQELIGPETFDINSMMNFIENEKATKFYFDQKMQGRSEGDRAAVYLWLDTGYVSQRDNATVTTDGTSSSDYGDNVSINYSYESSTGCSYTSLKVLLLNNAGEVLGYGIGFVNDVPAGGSIPKFV